MRDKLIMQKCLRPPVDCLYFNLGTIKRPSQPVTLNLDPLAAQQGQLGNGLRLFISSYTFDFVSVLKI